MSDRHLLSPAMHNPRVVCRVTPEVRDQLQRVAALEGQSVSDVMRHAIEAHLQRENGYRAKVTVLESPDAGRTHAAA